MVEPVSDELLAQIAADRVVSFRQISRTFDTPSGLKHAVIELDLTRASPAA